MSFPKLLCDHPKKIPFLFPKQIFTPSQQSRVLHATRLSIILDYLVLRSDHTPTQVPMPCHPSRYNLVLVFIGSCWYIPKGARSQTVSIPTFAALPGMRSKPRVMSEWGRLSILTRLYLNSVFRDFWVQVLSVKKPTQEFTDFRFCLAACT